jgi:hypothetical protein
VIIRHEVGVPGLRKARILLFFVLPASAVWLSCGGYNSSGSTQTSGLKYRAFITNSVSSGSSAAGVYILNAAIDVLPPVSPMSAGNTPGMMVVTPNRAQTLVFSGSGTQGTDNRFSFINNAAETVSGGVTLPGMTESFVVSPDSSAVYIAVPTAEVIGQSPGVLKAASLSSGSFTGEVDIPSIHYLSMNHSGNRILGFSDVLASLGSPCDPTPSYLFILTPSNVGIQPCPAVPVAGALHPFDHPVQAFFTSDDSTAFVVNCGAECGGIQASVQKLEMTPSQCLPDGACAAVSVPAASEALVNGSTVYLAGTPLPAQACPAGTLATSCGLLTIFDLDTMSVTNTTPIVITDGYHNRIALGANGQLFIGSRTCTEIIPPQPPPQGAEVRGCLSIYNTLNGAVVVPPANGDVTGLQPIATRTVVYVVQGGSLNIYDTATDALEINPHDPNQPGRIFGLVGQFFDVKTIDF